MSRRTRIIWITRGGLAVALFVATLSAILILRSDWFRETVRARVIFAVERATGGRAEIGAFHFDWRQMRTELDGFVLHGTEPANGPPLFRADAIVLGIKIVSVFKRTADLQYLDVRHPQIYTIIYADGHTNLPSPKVHRHGKTTLETILDLAIGRLGIQNGSFEIAGQQKIPFEAQGRDLHAQFLYDTSGPRYNGQLSVAHGTFDWNGYRPVPLDVSLTLAVERDRLRIDAGRLATVDSEAEFAGTISSLMNLTGELRYKARASLGEITSTLKWRTPLEGPVTLIGRLNFHGAADYQSSGELHAAGLLLRPDPHITLTGFRADGEFALDPRRILVSELRFGGQAKASLTSLKLQPFPVAGRIQSITLREKTIDASGIHINALDGSFEGKTQVADFAGVHVEGAVTGFDARKTMLLYDGQSVPWDGLASGPFALSATLGKPATLHLSARMAISPKAHGAPVTGSLEGKYDGSSGTLDMGTSWLALPATRLDFSGVLGKQLRVHADSHDLDEVLPALDIAPLPVKLANGEALFNGTITGKLEDPRIVGHAAAANLVWSGRMFTALSGDVDVNSTGLSVLNGEVRLDGLRAQGAGSLEMHDWKAGDASPVTFSGFIRNAPLADLMALADIRNVPVAASINADGKIGGTLGAPNITATFTALKGSVLGEPFERFTGNLDYDGKTAQLENGQLAAGAKSIAIQASYHREAGNTGQVSFKLDSNAMPVAQFQTISTDYPGIAGTAELHASGVVGIMPAQRGRPAARLISLNGTVVGHGLRINDQPLRDATLTLATKGSQIEAHFDSELAGSIVEGEGKWNLADDYPGSMQVSFKHTDLERLRVWLRGKRPPGGIKINGSVEGTLTVTGPAINPDLWKAELRIPSLQVGPGEPAPQGQVLALHNPAPIVIGMERGVVKVESFRLTGRATDLSLSGTVNVERKEALDLRVNGRFDLASLRDFNRDLYGSGFIETGVTIRGTLAQPQVAGRLELAGATFNLADFPVVVSNVKGVILFDGSRATIQDLSGESGGGKVTLTGFAGLEQDDLVFHLRAVARELRLRYPEDFSTVANASLTLTGTSSSSTLSGHITVLRTGFNPHSDFSSVLAKSAEPMRTPSAQTGLLANMRLDISIDSSPDVTFESSLAQGVQAEISLRLRGTGANPSLLGRINITGGQLVFFGTPFTVNQGSIAFYNPVKIEPVLDFDLDTKARGVDVILNISGPINKLNLTPRSDPPMPLSDIVALLATGVSPTSNYATLMAGPASPQSMQQLGASALLGEAIASPVTGRLQRFFGVTRLKIDPTLTGITGGVENNPQARLTIEQQVTPEITFTYITDVTSADPLVLQVEWAFSRRWSAVLLREENGLVGLNFVYKRRF